ncbi:MAG: hypothetical protein RL336_864 [Pseudomonadota bacterium]
MIYATQWPYAYGGPSVKAVFKENAEDFVVVEQLGFEPEGQGEHVFLWIEKRNSNTTWVAEQLARFASVPSVAVGYSGLKDRQAVTQQWFSVSIHPDAEPDWRQLESDELRVLKVERHLRKLKRGVHKSNHFTIRMRHIEGDRDKLHSQLKKIKIEGFPNLFGEQRFGRMGNNLRGAERMFAGQKVKRQQRQFYLSAGRSWLFNTLLAERLASNDWLVASPQGHYFLSGSGSHFHAAGEADLVDRVASGDIHPAAPLWGRTKGQLDADQSSLSERYPVFCQGLEAAGMNMEFRAVREIPNDFEWRDEGDTMLLSFSLGRGSFATALLRECFDWSEAGAE